MNEVGAGARHLVNTATADPDVAAFLGDRFYHAEAPADAEYPLAVYSAAGGADTLTGGADERLIVQARWLLLVIHNQNDPDLVRRIASAIDNALVGSTGTVSIDSQDYFVQTVYREEPVERSGQVDGEFYVNVGGYYRTPCYAVL